MSWLQLQLPCAKADADGLEDLLLELGAVSVTLEDAGDQPLLEPGVGETPLWDAVRLSGLFTADTDMALVLAALPGEAQRHTRVEILEDRDWEREWMQHYQPIRCGERLWICPSWMDPPEPDAINLLLDPGLAFGTGTHPTTAMCLAALDATPLDGCRVVDYGCGSGILAIAAARLGATSILGVDNDPQALAATRDNAERNGVACAPVTCAPGQTASPQTRAERPSPPGTPSLDVFLPDGYPRDAWQGRADLVVANILAGPLGSLRDELCNLLAPGGQLLLAGLLDTQAEALIAHYAPRLALNVREQRQEWVLLEGRAATA